MKTVVLILVAAVIVAGAAAFGVRTWMDRRVLPPGFASGNGRIEATEIDIAAKYPARIATIKVEEGDLVQPGEVLAELDTREIAAQLAAAEAQVEQARQAYAETEHVIAQRKTELQLAATEYERNLVLLGGHFVSQQRVDNLQSVRDTAQSALAAAESRLLNNEAAIRSAEATVAQLKQQLADGVLTSPRVGRVLFRLAEPGEVVGAGGKVLTVLDLSNIYMTIFLPASAAGALAIGTDARIVVEPLPDRAIPGNVSFVSAKAQFTPKQVETADERNRMMFRVKIRVPQSLVEKHLDQVKTGVPGVAYVRLDPKAAWPDWLQSDLTEDTAATSEGNPGSRTLPPAVLAVPPADGAKAEAPASEPAATPAPAPAPAQ